MLKPKPMLSYIKAFTFFTLYHNHLSALKTGFRNIATVPLATLTTIVAIGLCLSFPMSLYLFIKNISQLSPNVEQDSAITLYLQPKISSSQATQLLNEIKLIPLVEKTTYISSEEALKEFQANSNLQDTLALLPENPLPAIIRVELPRAIAKDTLTDLKETFEKMPNVNLVTSDYEWAFRLHLFLSLGKALSQFLYLMMGFGVILIIGNTIRLAMERHREEIEVFSLIGATTAFIRRPFLYRGILYGALGGIVTLLILSGGIYLLKTPVQDLASLYEGIFQLQHLPFLDTMAFLLASILLGWAGAIFAFAQQNRAL